MEDLPDSKETKVEELAGHLKLALSQMYDVCDSMPITNENVRSLVAFCSKYNVPKGIRACDTYLSTSITLHDGIVQTGSFWQTGTS